MEKNLEIGNKQQKQTKKQTSLNSLGFNEQRGKKEA